MRPAAVYARTARVSAARGRARRRRTCALAHVVTVLLATPSAAYADETGAESEPWVQRGIELRRVGRNREALEEFQRAYSIEPTPRVGAQIALAHQALGEWVDAEQGIEGALQAADDAWIARYRDVLEESLTAVRGHLGTLYVEANVSQGQLRLNGLPSEPMPGPNRPIRVAAGTSQFELRAPGYVAVTRSVEIAAGAQVHVVITLEPVASTDPIVAAAAPAGSVAVAQPRAARERSNESLADAPHDTRSTTWAYLAFAAGGVLAGGGVVAWRVHEDNAALFNNDSRCLMGPLTRGEQCPAQAQAANVALGFEIGAFAGAVGSAAVGAWLLWWPRARSGHVAAACVPWSTLGVQCAARF